MDKRTLTCIGCPLGCTVEVTTENGQILSVTGNTCKRAKTTPRKEVTNPTRLSLPQYGYPAGVCR